MNEETLEKIDEICDIVPPGEPRTLLKEHIVQLCLGERLEERSSVKWMPDEGKWIEAEAERIVELQALIDGDNKGKEQR